MGKEGHFDWPRHDMLYLFCIFVVIHLLFIKYLVVGTGGCWYDTVEKNKHDAQMMCSTVVVSSSA